MNPANLLSELFNAATAVLERHGFTFTQPETERDEEEAGKPQDPFLVKFDLTRHPNRTDAGFPLGPEAHLVHVIGSENEYLYTGSTPALYAKAIKSIIQFGMKSRDTDATQQQFILTGSLSSFERLPNILENHLTEAFTCPMKLNHKAEWSGESGVNTMATIDINWSSSAAPSISINMKHACDPVELKASVSNSPRPSAV